MAHNFYGTEIRRVRIFFVRTLSLKPYKLNSLIYQYQKHGAQGIELLLVNKQKHDR